MDRRTTKAQKLQKKKNRHFKEERRICQLIVDAVLRAKASLTKMVNEAED